MNDNHASQAGQPAGGPVRHGIALPRRILVADDEINIRELNTKSLSLCGYQVDAAEDGDAAWQALNANAYDLLITDHNMPKVTGLELVKKLRAAQMALPFILATGIPPTDEYAQSPWLIPDATLLKPYTIAELLGTVKNVLHASAREALRPEQSADRSLPARSPDLFS
jgi:DNA-binding response OmpR family regulator